MKIVVDIETASRKNKTFLKKGFAAHPFRVADITEHRPAALLQLMLMSSSPGILDGDHYQLSIALHAGSSLELKTQSYQRIFNMKHGASQHMNIFVHSRASFTYLPYPSVPHASSIFSSRNKIFLTDRTSRLIWGEVITCGRNLNGEQFRFTSYHSLTEIYIAHQLVIRENLVMKPAGNPLSGMGMLEGYTHQASLLFVNDTIDIQVLKEEIHQWLSLQQNICFGISALAVNGIIIRILGFKAEQLYQHLQYIAAGFMSKQPDAVTGLPSFIKAEANAS